MDVNILVISPDQDLISRINSVLSKSSYKLSSCKTLCEATSQLNRNKYNLLIFDNAIWNEGFPFQEFETTFIDLDIIIVTKDSPGKCSKPTSSQNRMEYLDFFKDIHALPLRIQDIVNFQYTRETAKRDLLHEYCFDSENASFNKMIEYCEKVANSSVNILLTGESGSGKEIAAKYIHACSKKNRQPFVAVNCSSYSDTLLESELFGHEQGSFTGAIKSRNGKFQSADKGTLFLDEVGDISLPIQVKLLRVIETKKIERIGSDLSKQIDFRLITATNQDLSQEILTSNFREDFFYRINTIVIQIPPLRERPEDLEMLIKFFLKKSQKENYIEICQIQPEVQEFLHSYDYPGNIRELKSIIDRMVILSENGVITRDGLPIMHSIKKREIEKESSPFEFEQIISFQEFKRRSETEYLKWVFEKLGWNVAEAARNLSLSTRQLFNKINEYDLKTPKNKDNHKESSNK